MQKVESVKKKYEDDNKKRFEMELEKKKPYAKFEKDKEEYIKEKEDKLQFDKVHARKMPDFKEVDIKMNAAAIQREGHQIKKKEEEEAKIMKDFEMNLRDEKEFERWKRENDEKEEIERLEHIQRKKIEMEMSRDQAIEA